MQYCANWRVAVFMGKAFTTDPPIHSELGSIGARTGGATAESLAEALSLRSWSPSPTVLTFLASVAASHANDRPLSSVAAN